MPASKIKFIDGIAVVKNGRQAVAKVFDRAEIFKGQAHHPAQVARFPYSLQMFGITRECGSLDEVQKIINQFTEV